MNIKELYKEDHNYIMSSYNQEKEQQRYINRDKKEIENYDNYNNTTKYSVFLKTCEACQDYIRESNDMFADDKLKAYHQAKFGNEKAKKIYMNKIDEYINNILKIRVEFPNVYDNLQEAIYHESYGMGKIYFWLEKRDEKLLEIEELSKIDKDWIKKQIDKNIQSTDLIINKDREAYIKYDTAQKVFKLFKLEQKTINRIASTLITNDKTANYRENYHELYTKNNNRVTLIQLKDGTKKIDIRRFVIQDFSLHFLSREFKSFPEELIPVLESLVKLNANILLAGGTGSGKSTLMNCFLKVRDMQKDNGSGILVQKDPEIEIKKIMKNSLCNEIILKEEGMEKIESKLLRSSADYFIFTEMKEKDVIEIFLKIIGRGSEGNMVTYHSSEAEQMIDGIAEQFPEKYKQVQKKLARNLDVVILVQKVKISKNEKRKMITKIVMPYIENNQIEYSTIYEYKVSKNIAKFFELPKNQSTENIKNRNYEEYKNLRRILEKNKEIGKIKY